MSKSGRHGICTRVALYKNKLSNNIYGGIKKIIYNSNPLHVQVYYAYILFVIYFNIHFAKLE